VAGLGRKVFTAGEVLEASEVNGYLMDQAVMVFADSAARTAAIASPSEGMVTYLQDLRCLPVACLRLLVAVLVVLKTRCC
jgi:hypothetical protein